MSRTARTVSRKLQRSRSRKRHKSSPPIIHVHVHPMSRSQHMIQSSRPNKSDLYSSAKVSSISRNKLAQPSRPLVLPFEEEQPERSPVMFDTHSAKPYSTTRSETSLISAVTFGNTNNYHRSKDDKKQKKKKFLNLKYCMLICPLCLILVGAIITALCLSFLLKPNTTVSSTSSHSSSYSSSATNTRTSTASTIVSAVTTATSSISTTTMNTTMNTSCSPTCNSQSICIQTTCVGIGYLSFAITWSRAGDGDIVVTTPNSNTISYNNLGPSSGTDQGMLDVDDTVGTGPENVVWPNTVTSSTPPNGVYYICFEPYAFVPSVSLSDPITISLQIYRGAILVSTIVRTFTSPVTDNYQCTASSSNLLGSHTYP